MPKGPVDITFEEVALPSGYVLNLHIEGGVDACLPVGELDAEGVSDMLLGLDTPTSGRILLSNVNLRDLSRGSLRRGVQRITSTPEILEGSMRHVLVMGCSPIQSIACLQAWLGMKGLGRCWIGWAVLTAV